jgi:branched-chain amino acid transport system substrate-binding protein
MKKSLAVLSLLAIMAVMSLSAVSAQDKVIKIASQSPLSGPQSSLGIAIRNGVELAITQLSGPLTEMGYTIEFVPFDDQASPDKGVSNAQQIVADPAILGVIGHLNSGVAIPSSEVYNTNDLVMISPANTNPNVTDRGYPTVNRICGRDDLQGPTGANFAVELGVETVYILHDTTAYGLGLADFFRMEAEALELEILGFDGTEEAASFDSVITPILALQPDMIYFGGIYSQTGIFISQARAAGYEGFFMGGDGFDNPEFIELAGEAGVGTFYTSTAGPASVFPAAQQFIDDYTAAFGEPPRPYAVEAYDSTAILLDALARAIEAAGGLPTRAQVAEAVRATENFEGLTGTVTFDDNGDREYAAYYILEVGSADPALWGENEIIAAIELPSPLVAKMMEEEEAGG